MKQQLRYLFAGLLLGISLQSTQAADLTDHPGYLDVDQLSYIDGREPNVEITLNGPVLKMLLQLPVKYDDEEETKELLKSVDQILVRVYNVDPDQADNILALIGETSATLEQQDWTRIVRVREGANAGDDDNDNDDESVDIHVKLTEDGESLNGLVIMAVNKERHSDEAEVVFVNIAGTFDPAYLANIGSQFDIDHLDGVEVP
jgi:hypothetical protein